MAGTILFIIFLVIILSLVGLTYYWRYTPHGLLNLRTAMVLRFILKKKENLPIEIQRKLLLRTMEKLRGQAEEVEHVEDIEIEVVDGKIPIRVYHPSPRQVPPIVLFFHGGGWTLGSLESHDHICRKIAVEANVLVVSVGYRLAPEYPFPTGLEDCYHSLQWVHKNGERLGGDAQKIIVMGDSAGGNLATTVALKAKNENGPPIIQQVLIYPVTNITALNTPSYNNFSMGYHLTKKRMDEFRRHYSVNGKDWANPYVSPLLADDLQNLPPALIITASFDPLRDEGEAYGKKMKAAGVEVTISRYKGTIHGFFGLSGLGTAGDKAIKEVAELLKTI